MIDAYLSLLGLPRAAPSAAYLAALHRAHVSRIPYCNVELMRGHVTPIDPEASVRQVLDGHGGYCFHLNGAFSWLLRELGFAVTLHRGYVRNRQADGDAPLNHLVLVVHDLDGGAWFTDTGLGDALYEPLPLTPGVHRQGPFRYELRADGHWHFIHDPSGSFESMRFEPAAARIDDFAEVHHRLSTAPDSSFRRFLTAQIRTADRVRIVRGCTYIEIDATGRHEETLDTPSRWRDTLASLGITGCDDLWLTERAAHEAWMASL